MPDLVDLRREIDLVRAEIRDLKKCQVQYFMLSAAATAALLGLGQASVALVPKNVILIAPLAVLLPCWWIFFDKATTITRDVGYARVIESMIVSHPEHGFRFLGFERALAKFREYENRGLIPLSEELPSEAGSASKDGAKGTRHRYWVVNWLTFCFLSFTCLLLSALSCSSPLEYIAPAAAALAFLASFGFTFRILRSLMRGVFSYDRITQSWEYVLARQP